VGTASFSQAFEHIPSGLDLAFLDLAGSERQDFQESQRVLSLLVAFDALHDYFGFAVLRDDQWLALFIQIPYDFGGMGFQVTDRLNLARQFHGDASIA
jgi:hypothetical protein